MQSDHELLAAYTRDGSEAAFAELVQRHAGAVHAAALRQTHQPQLAEEVMQAVFLRLAQKAKSMNPKSVVLGWLLRATRYAAIDAVRAEVRREEHHATLAKMPELDATPGAESDPHLWDLVAPVLDAALARLRAPDRDALVLRYLSRHSLAEVGAALGIAEEAARKRVTRALDRLREELARLGATTSAAALPELLLKEAAPAASSAVLEAALKPGPAATQLAQRVATRAFRQQALGGLGSLLVLVSAAVGTFALTTGFRSGAPTPGAGAAGRVSDYRLAGFPDAAVVHRQLAEIQSALRRGDRPAVARAIRFPLRINRAGTARSIANATEFLTTFEEVFSPAVTGALLQAPDHGLFCDRVGIMVGAGLVWLGPDGNPAQPEARIIAVNPP